MSARTLARQASRLLPAPLLAYLRKRHRHSLAAQRARLRNAALARHGQVTVAELADVLQGLGITAGSVLFVQTSFNDLHTFAGKPMELVKLLRQLAGPGGTLLMPAYTVDVPSSPAAPLDVANLPTYTGIVNELFRRSPGVLRSLHPRHSVCAEGPLAAQLLAGHEACRYADGPGSPLDRLRQMDGALILTLGLPPGFTSFLHWLEDHEPDRLPFPVHEPQPKTYVLRHPAGHCVEVDDMQVQSSVAARLNLAPVAAALGPDAFRWCSHRGLDIGLYFVKPFSERLVALRDQGVFHYH